MSENVKAGGGTEGEEYVAASAKVVLSTDKYWRRLPSNRVFTSIQAAIDSLA